MGLVADMIEMKQAFCFGEVIRPVKSKTPVIYDHEKGYVS